jgi:hypothetical protein
MIISIIMQMYPTFDIREINLENFFKDFTL